MPTAAPAQPYPETVELLSRLVAFPTVSADSNLGLIDFAESWLQAAGFQTTRLASAQPGKAGLMARLGAGPGGVLLSGHSDVVPVAGQDWSLPPFALTRQRDRLHGRGTTDMKGFLASALALAGRAGSAQAGPPGLARPLMLALSYDEEIGCTGIREMLPGIRALGWQPEFCIVGEPTGMRPAIGHKGKAAFLARCRGQAGHSALAPHYVNALHLAADLIAALRDLQADYASAGARDTAYEIPYSTVHAGMMQGGTALNIVPDLATVAFEIRHLPADSLEDFRDRLAARLGPILAGDGATGTDTGIQIEMTNSYPGLEIAADHPAVAAVAALAGSAATTKVAYGTEAGYFAALGVPTLVCGPGDMGDQGHKPDESLPLAQLAACDAMMDRLLLRLRG